MQPMQNEKATGFWSSFLSEKAELSNRIFGVLKVFEKEVRWEQMHCVASGLLQSPTRQPAESKSPSDAL